MRPLDALLLFGVGGFLLAVVDLLAARKGCFSSDLFPSERRRRAALALLFLAFVSTVLVPAASGTREVDTSRLRFPDVFLGQGLLLAFLCGWWLLSGRPSLPAYLALRTPRPWADAGAGLCLGLIGWGLTLVIGVVVAAVLASIGAPGPSSIPPLVLWIARLPWWQKGLLVLSAATLEEFFFRSFLQRRIGILAASLFFVLSHGGYGDPLYFVGLSGITAVLALAFRQTGSALAPMVAHGTFNAVQLFLVLPAVLKVLDRS